MSGGSCTEKDHKTKVCIVILAHVKLFVMKSNESGQPSLQWQKYASKTKQMCKCRRRNYTKKGNFFQVNSENEAGSTNE